MFEEQVLSKKMTVLLDTLVFTVRTLMLLQDVGAEEPLATGGQRIRKHRNPAINSMKPQDGRVFGIETVKLLKSFKCIQQLSLSLHLPPLLHAVSIQLETQKTEEGVLSIEVAYDAQGSTRLVGS